MAGMNITEVGNMTYYQCGADNSFVNNVTGVYTLKSAYICGYQQALYKSEGKRLTVLSSLYSIFAIMLMFCSVFCT